MIRSKTLHVLIAALAVAGAQPATAQTRVVTTVGNSFSPANITIIVGGSIMWMNLAAGLHTVTETNCPTSPASVWNGGFRSGNPGAVPTFTVQFNTVGTFCYICETHLLSFNMVGMITVETAPEVIGAPTLSPWAMGLLGGIFLLLGVWVIDRRRARSSPHRA